MLGPPPKAELQPPKPIIKAIDVLPPPPTYQGRTNDDIRAQYAKMGVTLSGPVGGYFTVENAGSFDPEQLSAGDKIPDAATEAWLAGYRQPIRYENLQY